MREFYQLPPDSPEMPLIFAVGPLCGTAAPTAARLAVVSRSPLTNTICDCSAGGRFAWRLKAAGFDYQADALPDRFFKEPGSSGEEIEIHPLDRGRFEEELQIFSALCYDY